ncbi:SUKH-4 family immunity protein [Streptomyces sp. 21So2-11]|uniref:SUKH-4 family immunity protein n=1 Tax=Streptomyces sp. 21So2-11 TaxID=3144408 RepID=UPI00321BA01B
MQVVRVVQEELHPLVVHGLTRARLSGEGVPRQTALLGFGPVAEGHLATVAEQYEHAVKLPDGVGEMLVIGHLLDADGEELEEIVLDGRTGRVALADLESRFLEARPLATDLDTLLRMAGAVEELGSGVGEFGGRFAGQYGPEAVTRLTEALREVADADGDYWTIAVLIRPLVRIAGPGDGLRLQLPEGLLDDEFGAESGAELGAESGVRPGAGSGAGSGTGGVARFADADLPAALTHEPTRRFLRDVGLPVDGGMFTLDDDRPARTLAEVYAHQGKDLLPDGSDRLICLGYLVEDIDLVVDGATGLILGRNVEDAGLRPVNADVSTLAFTLWLLRRARAVDAEHKVTDESYAVLAATMREVLAEVDPVACGHAAGGSRGDDGWRYWPEAFDDEAGGAL